MRQSPAVTHTDLLVGISGSDDAGVYRLGPEAALVQTVDYFTPVVDDPTDWGRIAAANALSDVYAMGGRPLTALQIVGWPRETLPLNLLGDVMDGGAEVLTRAGCVVVGGHSLDDPEPKYGLAVTGLVHPDHIVRNAGAAVGDVLVLTKPLGSGVVTTAAKHREAPGDVLAAAVATMTELNDVAGAALRPHRAHAATDITGYGLLGHLGEMLTASGVGAEIDAGKLPVLPGVTDLIGAGMIAGGTRRNRAFAEAFTTAPAGDNAMWIACDAQTSGGLLVSLPPQSVDAYIEAVPGTVTVGLVVGGPPLVTLT